MAQAVVSQAAPTFDAAEIQNPTTLLTSRSMPSTISQLSYATNMFHPRLGREAYFHKSAGMDSTGKGILIGILSAFGSAILISFILAAIYFLRYTNRGRILLDRMGRPGEYDDEQAFAKEEADALETMDDIQRAEYLRAKGKGDKIQSRLVSSDTLLSIHTSKPP